MDKLRWQTFNRVCGLCGGLRISLESRTRAGRRSGYRFWRWCPRCDVGLRSPEPTRSEEPKEAKGE